MYCSSSETRIPHGQAKLYITPGLNNKNRVKYCSVATLHLLSRGIAFSRRIAFNSKYKARLQLAPPPLIVVSVPRDVHIVHARPMFIKKLSPRVMGFWLWGIATTPVGEVMTFCAVRGLLVRRELKWYSELWMKWTLYKRSLADKIIVLF